MDYAEIYKNWNSFEACRMVIRWAGDPVGTTSESIWGKVLPDGKFGIDNIPLTGRFMWQDIVEVKKLDDEMADTQVLHRRWNHRVAFEYVTEGKNEDERVAQRKKIHDTLEYLGDLNFWSDGLAFLLVEKTASEDATLDEAIAALDKVGVKAKKLED